MAGRIKERKKKFNYAPKKKRGNKVPSLGDDLERAKAGKCQVTELQLREALLGSEKQRKICQLLQSIPADCWAYPEKVGYAEALLCDGTRIAAIPTGGVGINTYTSVSLRVFWRDGTKDCLGACSAEELRLPKYGPPPLR